MKHFLWIILLAAACATPTTTTTMPETQPMPMPTLEPEPFRADAPIPAATRPYAFPEITRGTLENGLRILIAQNRNAPLVSVRAIVRAGAERDPLDRPAMASLTADMLEEGTPKRNAIEIAEAIGDLGATLSTGADWDAAFVALDILSRNLEEGFSIFADVVIKPTFPKKELDRVRKERITTILQQKDHPAAIAGNRFAAAVYGGTPYGNPLIGTEESIGRILKQDLEAFYQRHYVPNNTSLIITGDVDVDAARALAERTFRDWARGPAVPPVSLKPKPLETARIVLIDRPSSVQSEIRIGHAGVARNSEDYFPLITMNSLLGGIFTSRLNLNLRERHGYTYGIRSGFSFRRHGGPFQVSTAVQNAVTRESVNEILSELRLLRSGDVTDAEMNDSKNYLMGVFPQMVQTASDLANRIQELELYDLPEDYFDRYRERIAAVNRQDI
ncbi:MAG TPA: pitrilysin family protein, partial [Thermoanaerobaculia bacterium]